MTQQEEIERLKNLIKSDPRFIGTDEQAYQVAVFSYTKTLPIKSNEDLK